MVEYPSIEAAIKGFFRTWKPASCQIPIRDFGLITITLQASVTDCDETYNLKRVTLPEIKDYVDKTAIDYLAGTLDLVNVHRKGKVDTVIALVAVKGDIVTLKWPEDKFMATLDVSELRLH